jgi:hypothetical protein
MKRRCVKKEYTEKEAQKEMLILCLEEHKNFFGSLIKWGYEYCEECRKFHLLRGK